MVTAWHFAFTGDLVTVGRCLSEYWVLKKKMADGCEPELVTRMMHALEPLALGMCLAGAGGGGFMYLLTKEPNSTDLVKRALQVVQVASQQFQCHRCSFKCRFLASP